MEGVGSRLGRASSRYGASTTAAVFSGPVRKWKKKWVQVSPTSAGKNNSNSNGKHGNSNSNSRLVLCRWTPLPPATTTSSSSPEEPPKRKFRYTPIAVLEERKKAAEKDDDEVNASENNQFTPMETPKKDELNSDSDMKTDNQDSNLSNLDLGLCLKGHNSDYDSIGESNGDQLKKTSSAGLFG